eukprot:4635575-Prymnesium_polylepis.1
MVRSDCHQMSAQRFIYGSWNGILQGSNSSCHDAHERCRLPRWFLLVIRGGGARMEIAAGVKPPPIFAAP